MTLTQLYLFTVILPNAYEIFNFLGATLFIGGAICLIVSAIIGGPGEEPEAAKLIFKYSIKFFITAAVLGIIAIPLPSQNQLYALAGGYVATNAKDVAKLPDNIVKAANAWLEKAAALADEKPKTKSNQ